GIRFVFTDGSRIIFRLSGTGSQGATIRLYVEQYTADPKLFEADTQAGLKGLIDVALKISKLKEYTGRDEPTIFFDRLPNFINMTANLHFWLRAETKANEHRTAITPSAVKKLLENGIKVSVERCTERIFNDSDYEIAGAVMVPHGSWRTAPKDAYIIGLKELPENDFTPLIHTHIMFAHCFKGQAGWKDVLGRFERGQGALLDLEFLNDDRGAVSYRVPTH
ncbi:Saccharopine dehydrogenase, partial [Chytridiales sp. JEL 0842]